MNQQWFKVQLNAINEWRKCNLADRMQDVGQRWRNFRSMAKMRCQRIRKSWSEFNHLPIYLFKLRLQIYLFYFEIHRLTCCHQTKRMTEYHHHLSKPHHNIPMKRRRKREGVGGVEGKIGFEISERKVYSSIYYHLAIKVEMFSLKVVLSVLSPVEWIYAYNITYRQIDVNDTLHAGSVNSPQSNIKKTLDVCFCIRMALCVLRAEEILHIAQCTHRDQIDIKSFYIVYFACNSQKCHCIAFHIFQFHFFSLLLPLFCVPCFCSEAGVWLALFIHIVFTRVRFRTQ